MAAYNFITESGVVVPDFADTLAQVEAEYRAIEGFEDADLSPETKLGALMLREVLIRDGVARNNAIVANQINPDLAQGVFLDALFSFMGGSRFSATYSIIRSVTLTGQPTTVIPKGSLAFAGDNSFKSLSTVILNNEGKGYSDFQAVLEGPIEAPIGSLSKIGSSVLGWETISNVNAAEVGKVEETMISARRRRSKILALQATETVEAIISALYDLPDVRSLSYIENYEETTKVIRGITLKPHSMWLCIDGGEAEQIAKTLKRVRGIGSGYNGSEEVTIVDPFTEQPYIMKFDRPITKNLFVRVTVKPSTLNAQELVPYLVQQFVTGQTESDEGLTVGRDLSPFEIAAGINNLQPALFVRKVEISDDGVTWSEGTYDIKVNELGVVQPSATTVIVL